VELAIVLEELGYAADRPPSCHRDLVRTAGRAAARGLGTGVFDGAGRFVLDATARTRSRFFTNDGVIVVKGGEGRGRAGRDLRPDAARGPREPARPGARRSGSRPDGTGGLHRRQLPPHPRPGGAARAPAVCSSASDRVVPGRQAQGGGHVRRDRAGQGAGLWRRRACQADARDRALHSPAAAFARPRPVGRADPARRGSARRSRPAPWPLDRDVHVRRLVLDGLERTRSACRNCTRWRTCSTTRSRMRRQLPTVETASPIRARSGTPGTRSGRFTWPRAASGRRSRPARPRPRRP